MSRKDHIQIATILKSYLPLIADEQAREVMIGKFIVMFKNDNPNFSPSRFRDACNS